MSEGLSEDRFWYKDAVVYQLHVKSFFDANNDGIGDFAGLMAKLDYIADLGVTAVWLLPFYPSPRKDDGYDIGAYCDVSPDYGSLDEVRAFIDAAHARGIWVITELVINHTSDQHPWFQAARKAPPGSPERDFYVWSDTDKLYSGTRIIFCDTEKSNWTWDEEAGAYFWHRFYSHQPDLNFDNPRVLEEVISVMHFWLEAGVDGLRLDAIPYLIERDGTSNENLDETHQVLKAIRADLDRTYPGRMLLAEANMWPEDTQQYFGDDDECHMAFHFPLMPRMYMALAQEDRFPITDIMRQTPDIPGSCQWAIFLRNHDELTLEMVTDAERDYLWNTYAADKRARINLGIRRRLAPLMQRDRRRIELMHALLLTMPGTPVLYYGDEIGMGDNLFLGDRDGVRTPMQWSSDRNGGFSRADPAALTLPPIMDPLYGFQAVNVEAQQRDQHSQLVWLKGMLAVRKSHQAFGRGTQRFLRPANRKVLVYLREHGGDRDHETILCVANLSRTAQAVELDLAEFEGRTPVELTGGTAFPKLGQLPYLLTLPPYGFLWFRLSEAADPPEWSSAAPSVEAERVTFVLRPSLNDVLTGPSRPVYEGEVLPGYLPYRRWFGAKDERIQSVRTASLVALPGADDLLLTQIEVTTERATAIYTLPLGIAWEQAPQGPFASNLALARVRRGRSVGLLTDGFATGAFPFAIVSALRDAAVIAMADGEIRFETSLGFDLDPAAEPEWLAAEQSNSTLVLGRTAVLKLLRRIQPGIHPDVEMVRYLTANGFANVPPMLGTVTHHTAAGPALLMLLQGFVLNQGDGWQWTLGALERLATDTEWSFSNYNNFAANLGARLAEMHRVLALPTTDTAFASEAMTIANADQLGARIVTQLDTALNLLGGGAGLGDDDRDAAERLIAGRAALAERIAQMARLAQGRPRTRIHGDLHLGQVLVTGHDVMFIDFEGEPTRPIDERRAKDLPLRDVAGMLRSFDYAAAVAERSRPAAAETQEQRAGAGAAKFRDQAMNAFLSGYFGENAASDPLLGLFVLEKAAYEVAYEAANRPDWLRVPVRGLAQAAERLLGEAPA